MHDWSGAGTKPLDYQPLTHRCGPPFQHRVTQCPRLCGALSGGKWVTIQPVKQGEVNSTQTLWIESVRRVVSQRKTKVLFTRRKERQMLNRKKKKTTKTTVCFKQAASYYACHKQGKSPLLAFQTISPLCCPSPPFPHQIFIDRALVRP